jgi:hypothetical protein
MMPKTFGLGSERGSHAATFGTFGKFFLKGFCNSKNDVFVRELSLRRSSRQEYCAFFMRVVARTLARLRGADMQPTLL